MGVPGLWPILGSAGTLHNLETLDLAAVTDDVGATAEAGASQRLPVIGVDISAWLYHARLSVEGSNPMLRLIFFRLARLLSLPIHAVFVFDGPLRPRIKRGKTLEAAKHPLTGPLMEMIAALGAVGWPAPGEAEAELAHMNKEGIVDAVLSDDVDSLVFGARAIMRNWSATLSGSKSQAAPSSEEHGENSVTIYKASTIEHLPDLSLDDDGMTLVAVLAGGDYDMGGLDGCGPKTAVALAQLGYGTTLVQAFRDHCRITDHDAMTNLPIVEATSGWTIFLDEWREKLRDELKTNSSKMLVRKQTKLANSDAFNALLDSAEALSVLASYVSPVTTWTLPQEAQQSARQLPSLRSLKFKEPNLAAVAKFAQRTFAWGPRTTVARMRNVIWKGLLIRELRRLHHSGPTSAGHEPRVEMRTIHSERRHAATGNLLEYRVEWDPTPFAQAAQDGIDPHLNVGPGYDEPYPDDADRASGSNAPLTDSRRVNSRSPVEGSDVTDSADDEGLEGVPISPYDVDWTTSDGQTRKVRKARPLPDPYSSLRSWILAERLEHCQAGRELIKEYKGRLANKGAKGKKRTTSKTSAAQRPANQKSIDAMLVPQTKLTSRPDLGTTQMSKPTGAQKVPGPPPASPQRFRQTHLPFAATRTFGRTQSGPAAAPSSSPSVSAYHPSSQAATSSVSSSSGRATPTDIASGSSRFQRAASIGTLREESLRFSDSDNSSDDDVSEHTRVLAPQDGFAHLRAHTAQKKQQAAAVIDLVSSSPVRGGTTPVARRHAPTRRPLHRQEPLLSSRSTAAEADISLDPDDSLPDAATMLRSLAAPRADRTGPDVVPAPTTSSRIRVRSRAVRSSSSTDHEPTRSSPSPPDVDADTSGDVTILAPTTTTTSPDPSPVRPSSSKRVRKAGTVTHGGNLPFLPMGKPPQSRSQAALATKTRATTTTTTTTRKGPPEMYPSSSSLPSEPDDAARRSASFSSSPPPRGAVGSKMGTTFTSSSSSSSSARRRGGRKSDAIVLSDSD